MPIGPSGREIALKLSATNQASPAINKVGTDLRQLGSSAKDASLQSFLIGTAYKRVGEGLITAGKHVRDLSVGVGKLAVDWQHNMQNVRTQTDITDKEFATLSDSALKLLGRIPQSAKELSEALYDIFSSTNLNAREAIVAVELFSKAAVAGSTDISTAARASIGMMNAFGLSAKELPRILDVQFNMVRYGVGTYEQFARSLGDLLPSSRAAGQSMETMSGAFAFATRQGMSTRSAAISVARAMDMLTRPKNAEALKRVLGIDVFDKATGKYKQINVILSEMAEKFKGMNQKEIKDVMYEIFKSGEIRANRFFNTAIPNIDQLNKMIKDVGGPTSTGAMLRAFEKMAASPAVRMDILQNALRSVGTQIALRFLPAIGDVVDIIAKWVDAFSKLSPETQDFIAKLVLAAGAFLLISGHISKTYGNLLLFTSLLKYAGTDVGGFTSILKKGGIAVLGFAGLAYLVISNWDKVSAWFKKNSPELGKSLAEAWDSIKESFMKMWAALQPALQALGAGIAVALKAAVPVIEVLAKAFAEVVKFIAPATPLILAFIVAWKGASIIGAITGGLITKVKAFFAIFTAGGTAATAAKTVTTATQGISTAMSTVGTTAKMTQGTVATAAGGMATAMGTSTGTIGTHARVAGTHISGIGTAATKSQGVVKTAMGRVGGFLGGILSPANVAIGAVALVGKAMADSAENVRVFNERLKGIDDAVRDGRDALYALSEVTGAQRRDFLELQDSATGFAGIWDKFVGIVGTSKKELMMDAPAESVKRLQSAWAGLRDDLAKTAGVSRNELPRMVTTQQDLAAAAYQMQKAVKAATGEHISLGEAQRMVTDRMVKFMGAPVGSFFADVAKQVASVVPPTQDMNSELGLFVSWLTKTKGISADSKTQVAALAGQYRSLTGDVKGANLEVVKQYLAVGDVDRAIAYLTKQVGTATAAYKAHANAIMNNAQAEKIWIPIIAEASGMTLRQKDTIGQLIDAFVNLGGKLSANRRDLLEAKIRTGDFEGAQRLLKEELIRVGSKSDETRDKITTYAENYKKVPKEVWTDIKAETRPAEEKVRAFLTARHDKTIPGYLDNSRAEQTTRDFLNRPDNKWIAAQVTTWPGHVTLVNWLNEPRATKWVNTNASTAGAHNAIVNWLNSASFTKTILTNIIQVPHSGGKIMHDGGQVLHAGGPAGHKHLRANERPAILEVGEWVTNRQSAKKYDSVLRAINADKSGGSAPSAAFARTAVATAPTGPTEVHLHIDGKVEGPQDLARELEWFYRTRGF